ncbi:unnamed protein product [Polarella glacialis]|uniref:Phospholipase/carboxylesterase/thioesterase domain-containing protein n=1 Tax=Polarella glacialis TaxID=89957 RepID=A0A813LSC7_POLGL|nr:unnamed protein product [Polarella glacialis]CAE8736975.1 unnamed protein product [Polarella glacialis]
MFDFDELDELLPVNDDFDESVCQIRKLVGFDCQIMYPSCNTPTTLAVVFFHGSGQPWKVEQERLFTSERIQQLVAAGVCVVLPASPLKDKGIHFWYNSDSAQIAELLLQAKQLDQTSLRVGDISKSRQNDVSPKAAGSVSAVTASGLPRLPSAGQSFAVSPLDAFKDGEPALMDVTRPMVLELIAAVEESLGLPCGRVVLGGFSQGAAVAMDCALHLLPKVPCAVGFFSGSLMCRQRWRSQFASAGAACRDSWRQLPMLQGHGNADWAVGVNGGRWLHTFCKDELGMQHLEYVEFLGGHTVPPELADKFLELTVTAACHPDATRQYLTSKLLMMS